MAMTDEEKQAIERLNNIEVYGADDGKAIETVLNLIEKQDNLINLMAKELTEERLSKFDWCSLLNGKGCKDEDTCLECMKNYFKNKVGKM